MKTLVLGGIRSGKSRLAADLAVRSGQRVAFIATAQAKDREMLVRIADHRAVRPAHWKLVEEPIALASAIRSLEGQEYFIVVDCLTLWLTNLLLSGRRRFERERGALVEGMSSWTSDMALVSNETSLGIVPRGALSRRFCEEAGRLHQELAGSCDRVLFSVAGLCLSLKADLPG